MKFPKPGNRLANAITPSSEEAPMGKVSGLAGRPKKTDMKAGKPKSVEDLKALYKAKFGKPKSGF